ncbi:MAG: hypothetical protein BGO77_00175 [Caedibacter sp. 37-49]|nr:MAG: hypothetical protein BGO77_00175 [Caedibacter sp. 37-49]
MENSNVFSPKTIQLSASQERISCAGYEQSGHPRVFLDVSKQDITICPYCSCQYTKNRKLIEQ